MVVLSLLLTCVVGIKAFPLADDVFERVHVHLPKDTYNSADFIRHEGKCLSVEVLELPKKGEPRWDTHRVLQAKALGGDLVGLNGNQVADASLVSVVGMFPSVRTITVDGFEEEHEEPVAAIVLTERKAKTDGRAGFEEVRQLCELKLSSGRWQRLGGGLPLGSLTSVPRYGQSSEGAGVALVDPRDGTRLLRSQIGGRWKVVWKLRTGEWVDVDKNSGELYVGARRELKLKLYRVKAAGLIPIAIPREIEQTAGDETTVLLAEFDDSSSLKNLVIKVVDRSDEWRVVHFGFNKGKWEKRRLLFGRGNMLDRAVSAQKASTGEFIAAAWEQNLLRLAVVDSRSGEIRQKVLKARLPALKLPAHLHIVDDTKVVHIIPRTRPGL